MREYVPPTLNGELCRHQGALSKGGGVMYIFVVDKGVCGYEIDDEGQQLEGKVR